MTTGVKNNHIILLAPLTLAKPFTVMTEVRSVTSWKVNSANEFFKRVMPLLYVLTILGAPAIPLWGFGRSRMRSRRVIKRVLASLEDITRCGVVTSTLMTDAFYGRAGLWPVLAVRTPTLVP
ncbi:hypothetical protein AVEN_16467-1 [Araneus ventricosus]|uniref:Uncharacterized protein n=1 Tax=Araneus ventricosus TaxID=182803 RepID=A0A4Y2PXS0_ARAVE|nr:hypothetical protein AVEN_16467-1 [Araneus ventricosus]